MLSLIWEREREKELAMRGELWWPLCVLSLSLLSVCQDEKDGEVEGEGCQLVLSDSEPAQWLLLTNISSPQTVLVRGGPDSDCQLALLAVGGGGAGFEYGGGGSGYLALSSQAVTPGETQLTVSVGIERTPSTVSAGGQIILEARPGHDGFYNNTNCGGDGYSGGGDGCCHPFGYPGGSDGSDGEGDGQQGRGTGEDISNYKFAYFFLSPGAGGYRKYGGGGGGVLVNGEGPPVEKGQGEGYGGGGEGYRPSHGLQGVVLMEIKQNGRLIA